MNMDVLTETGSYNVNQSSNLLPKTVRLSIVSMLLIIQVVIEVKIIVGAPLKTVVVQEVLASNATWLVLNRYCYAFTCQFTCFLFLKKLN